MLGIRENGRTATMAIKEIVLSDGQRKSEKFNARV